MHKQQFIRDVTALMILIYSQIQHIIQPIKCQAKGKLIIGTLFPKGSHSNRENEHLNIQEEIAEEVMYTMIRICTKAQWDTEEGATNYLQSGQRELPEEVICKLISMDESEDHFEMTKKISCTTVKSVHGEYFWVWKLEESFNSIEQAYAQSLLLPWVLCWVSLLWVSVL